jgi:transketolase
LVVDALEGGGRGHIGSPLSMMEIVRVLYDDVLRLRPADPTWRERDRFVLSKGHACLGLYAVLADKGFISRDELRSHCAFGALLGGHPERHIPGVEAATGSLGHGLSLGIGMALAAELDGGDARTFVLLGDGELDEGSVWEAALSAAKHRLDRLTAIVDYNKLQSYGAVSDVLDLEPLADKFAAFGFAVREVDGHDVEELRATFARLPFTAGKPNAIIAHTIKGRGFPFAEGDPNWHHKAVVKADDIARMRAALDAA